MNRERIAVGNGHFVDFFRIKPRSKHSLQCSGFAPGGDRDPARPCSSFLKTFIFIIFDSTLATCSCVQCPICTLPLRAGNNAAASVHLGGSAGGSVRKAQVLVLGELCCSGRSSGPQSRWGVGCRFGVSNPGWRRGRGIPRRRRVIAGLGVPGFFRVLLRDELEQGSRHGGADVRPGTGLSPQGES